jgi:branched-chain amino acid transport system substrate-binding protein
MSEERIKEGFSRRRTLGTLGGLAGTALLPGAPAFAQAKGKPIKIGFQVHRTGIGATYGRWFERTTTAAVKLMNEKGGIAGRPIEIVAEDDGTDPKRGPEVVEKLCKQHKVDFVYGTLFSHVVMASAPARRRIEDPLLRRQRGISRRIGKAEPLLLPARHHRRARASHRDGVVDPR